jgi:hypothetical protein
VSSFRSTSVFNTANFSGAKLSKSCKFRDVLRVNKTQVVLRSKSVAILRGKIETRAPQIQAPSTPLSTNFLERRTTLHLDDTSRNTFNTFFFGVVSFNSFLMIFALQVLTYHAQGWVAIVQFEFQNCLTVVF